MEKIVEVKELKKYFTKKGSFPKFEKTVLKAVDEVSLDIYKGETLGLVGESGCGKTTFSRSLVRLHNITSGTIKINGNDISNLTQKKLLPLRRDFQMIFQDPYASLNPRLTVKEIIAEPLYNFKNVLKITNSDIQDRVIQLIEEIGLSPNHLNRYPHEFSGGQRQRIGIARALALKPKLVVCDEPVSALDVSIQAQILNLLNDLKKKFDLTFLFIAHDLAVVRHISDRVAVMYLGKIVEIADYNSIYTSPLHPYTEALLSSIPVPDPHLEKKRNKIILKGELSDCQTNGCSFYSRCTKRMDVCNNNIPDLKDIGQNHKVACFLW